MRRRNGQVEHVRKLLGSVYSDPESKQFPRAHGHVRLNEDEARALRAYVLGDSFDTKFIDSALVKIERKLGP